MSPLQLYTILLGQVYQLFRCVSVLYFKIILDYVCSFWVLISTDQTPAPATMMAGTFLTINRQPLESCSYPLRIWKVF